MNFSVGRPNKNGHGFTNYQVAREGSLISIKPPDTGCRSYGDGYTMSVAEDQIDLITPDRQFRIKMSAEGVAVDDPRMDGMRGGGYDLVVLTPLKPEQYEGTGLSVAFGLIGFPLPPHLLTN